MRREGGNFSSLMIVNLQVAPCLPSTKSVFRTTARARAREETTLIVISVLHLTVDLVHRELEMAAFNTIDITT